MKLVDMYFWQIGFERDSINIDAAQPLAFTLPKKGFHYEE
jgi:hypothetical protein